MEIDFNNYYLYDERSPSFLIWRVSPSNRVKVGDSVGCLNADGYYCTSLKGKQLLVHRIIWSMFSGSLDATLDIDHLDGVRTNNGIENLRLVERELNARNYPIRKDNTSGVKGVNRVMIYRKGLLVYQGWRAFWHEKDGVRKTRTFNSRILGSEQAYLLACECRITQINRLKEEGVGYTDRHIGE